MDTLESSGDGSSRKSILGIEGHAGRISSVTSQTYQTQKSLDPPDTSQDYVVLCANGSPAPAKPALPGGWGVVQGSIGQNSGAAWHFYSRSSN